MHANSHHRPLLFVTVALQRGVATAAAVGPAQAHHLSLRLNIVSENVASLSSTVPDNSPGANRTGDTHSRRLALPTSSGNLITELD
ncbi:hypothetical protein Tco_0655929 [Tanacetum coccineum]|uniref:Secreted protein n=1 Tax=Tanacetum coccineum TaxID=301880 RepID=A0ABQ4X802_9ASTR